MLSIPVISGSIRAGRNTPRLARLLARKLDEHGDVEADLIDLAELQLPMLEERLKNLKNPPEALVRFGRTIAAADAVIVVTPEYNKAYPAALKNAIDGLNDEWKGKPVGIATHSTGAFGGTVALQALRPVLSNLGAVPIPATFAVPHTAKVLAEDGACHDPSVEDRAGRFVSEVVAYANALRGMR